MQLHGIIPALITPFGEDEELDLDGVRRMLDYTIEAGVHAVFVSGSTGEAYAMSLDERIRLFECAVEHVGKRVPVGAGTGANATRDVVRLSQAAEAAGCDYVSIITPSFITPSAEEMYEHYAAAAESVKLPVLLYGNPARTNNPLPTGLVARLARDYPNIKGIKDSTGDLQQFAGYVRECPEDFWTIMGRDSMVVAGLQYGGVGAICGSANIVPDILVRMYEAFRSGDLEEALRLQRMVIPLREAFALGSFPAMLKHAVKLLGLPSGVLRRPLRWLNSADEAKLAAILKTLGRQV